MHWIKLIQILHAHIDKIKPGRKTLLQLGGKKTLFFWLDSCIQIIGTAPDTGGCLASLTLWHSGATCPRDTSRSDPAWFTSCRHTHIHENICYIRGFLLFAVQYFLLMHAYFKSWQGSLCRFSGSLRIKYQSRNSVWQRILLNLRNNFYQSFFHAWDTLLDTF